MDEWDWSYQARIAAREDGTRVPMVGSHKGHPYIRAIIMMHGYLIVRLTLNLRENERRVLTPVKSPED